MTTLALLNVFSYVHGHDFTTDTNQAQLTAESEAKDKTTFGSAGWHEFAGGLKSVAYSMQGFWQSATSDAVDPQAFADLAVVDRVYTMGPVNTEGQPAWMFLGGHFNYQLLGQIGELAPFTLATTGTNGVGAIRGQLAKAKGTVSATGALGSVVNLGTVSATQFLYASFHVFGTPGTTITVQLQSDDGAGMGSPTTQATIGPLTAAGGTWATRAAGPLTDTHYRFNVSAITGTFTVAGAIGIA